MIFTASWLALRYLVPGDALMKMRAIVTDVLYSAGGRSHPPREHGQALYDLVAAVAYSGAGWERAGRQNSASNEAMTLPSML